MADAAKNNGKENEDKMNSMKDKLEDLESELAAARKKVLTMIKFYSVSTSIFTEKILNIHTTLSQHFNRFYCYYIGSYYLQPKQSEHCLHS